MNYRIIHTTEYDYFQPVSLCHNIAKLFLRETGGQHCRETLIRISPQPDVMRQYEDFFGNKVLYFAIQQEHQQLKVTVESTVEKQVLTVATQPDRNSQGQVLSWEQVGSQLGVAGMDNNEVRQYIQSTPFTRSSPEIAAYAALSFQPGLPLYQAANNLMHRIYTDFEFTQGITNIATPLSEVMQNRKGVCQDFAHLAIACIRSMGLSARYISGYIETIPAAGKEKLFGADASHAWFSVFIPGMGWVDFDPTNNIIPGMQHITIGWGRDYADIAPLKGVILSSGPHELKVSVDVRKFS